MDVRKLLCAKWAAAWALAIGLATTPVTAAPVIRVQLCITSDQVKYINEKVIPEFEKNYDVDVQLQQVNWNTRQDKLYVNTAGGVPPDVFENGSEHVLDLVRDNMLASLDEEINSWAEMKDFYPPTFGSSMYNGHRYGVPFYTSPRAWWYRTDIFEETGLDANHPPASWDELSHAARRITRVDGNKVVRQGYDLSRTFGSAMSSIQDFAVYLWQNSGELLDPQTYQAKFNETAGVETLEWLINLQHAVRAPGNVVDNGSGAGSTFLRGRVGVHFGGGWITSEIYKLDPSVANVVKAIVPPPGNKQQVGITFSAWLAVHSQSPNKQLAFQFIKTLSAPKTLYELNVLGGTQSPRRSTVASYVESQPLVRYLYETLNYSREYPAYPKGTDSNNVFGKQYALATSGQVAPKVALDEAARQWNIIAKEALK